MKEPLFDRAAMGRLADALTFICGADHAATIAMRTAAESGSKRTSRRPVLCFYG